MAPDHQRLWDRIADFELSDPDSEFNFVDRLARENDWSLEYAHRAVWEYKRFIFLICATQSALTPSDQVDQVWHLHLLYTHSYWIDFCQNTLEREIHHGPTKGGDAEKSKFKDLYQETQNLYATFFEEQPPVDIWPSSKQRFGALRFTRVNRHTHWVIPKLTFKPWKFNF